MREFGLINIDIIVKNNIFNLPSFIQTNKWLSQYCDGIFRDAFLYDKRIELDSIEKINTSDDKVYIIEYRIDNNNFFIQLYRDYVLISYSRYLDIPIFVPLKDILRRYIAISDFTIIGFETDLFIDEYPEGVDCLLKDESLYPFYVKEKDKLIFKHYGKYEPMDIYIEQLLFVFDVLGDNVKII